MRSLVALLLLSSIALASPPASVPERAAQLRDDGRRLTLSMDFPELADAAVQRRLDSGLATTVVTRAYLFKDGGSRVESLAVQTVRVAYDLWDEVWVVEQIGESGRTVTHEKQRRDVVRRIAAVDALPLVEHARLVPGTRYVVAVMVELNPVSPALLSQVRRWLSRPREGAASDGESYFGSFVSLFVNRKVGEAEKVLRFRTPVWVAP